MLKHDCLRYTIYHVWTVASFLVKGPPTLFPVAVDVMVLWLPRVNRRLSYLDVWKYRILLIFNVSKFLWFATPKECCWRNFMINHILYYTNFTKFEVTIHATMPKFELEAMVCLWRHLGCTIAQRACKHETVQQSLWSIANYTEIECWPHVI